VAVMLIIFELVSCRSSLKSLEIHANYAVLSFSSGERKRLLLKKHFPSGFCTIVQFYLPNSKKIFSFMFTPFCLHDDGFSQLNHALWRISLKEVNIH
jgi:hypothetical protein